MLKADGSIPTGNDLVHIGTGAPAVARSLMPVRINSTATDRCLSLLRCRVALGLTMVVLQGFSTYVQYGGNVLSFLDHAKVRLQ